MSNQKFLRLVLVALFALALAVPAFAQDQPRREGRKQKPELKKAYKDWLEKDVAYIITDQERTAFKKLQTDEERENFIELFWRRRDPDPDTDENEYREEYHEGIPHPHARQTSGLPRGETDP